MGVWAGDGGEGTVGKGGWRSEVAVRRCGGMGVSVGGCVAEDLGEGFEGEHMNVQEVHGLAVDQLLEAGLRW